MSDSLNISLIIINRFSVAYGGEPAIAAYAVIAYIISIIYMVFQGVGDGSQPLLSQCYGEKDFECMRRLRRLAYGTALGFALIGFAVMFGIAHTENRFQVAVLSVKGALTHHLQEVHMSFFQNAMGAITP